MEGLWFEPQEAASRFITLDKTNHIGYTLPPSAKLTPRRVRGR